jgi:hypothetical protein
MSNNEQNNEKVKVVEKKPSWIVRKMNKIGGALGTFWVMGKSGFYFGAKVGGVLGGILGLWESYRMKSIIPLPLAMLTSAFTFGSIFSVSSMIRSENDKEVEFNILYMNEEGEIKESIILVDKDRIFNNKI